MFSSYRNQLVDLLCKSTDWFLYDGTLVVKGLRDRDSYYEGFETNNLQNSRNSDNLSALLKNDTENIKIVQSLAKKDLSLIVTMRITFRQKLYVVSMQPKPCLMLRLI